MSRKAPAPKEQMTMMAQVRDRLLRRPGVQRVREGARQQTLLMGPQLWIPPWLAKSCVGTVEPRERKATFAPVGAAERWDNNKYSLPIAQYITLNITIFFQALYCNEKCQVEDWEKHGRFCRKTTKRRQRRKEARQRGGEVNEGGDGVEGQGGLEDFDGLSINEVD